MDGNNMRVQKFDAAGNFLLAWGGQSTAAEPGKFNDPWGVGVGPDGSVYVADTWNHRVQKFDADGNFLTQWGRFANDSAPDAFWGPRAVVVGPNGHVYVADTGNKRIAVFDADGQGLTTIGLSGFEAGQFDEPVGLAMDADGTLYVADTWNQRIQVFAPDSLGDYLFAREWTILGWESNSLDNKPYLAVDSIGRVYATDPENYRVLVFDPTGQLTAMWGEYGFDATTFSLPTGITLDAEGNVYVTDSGGDEDGNHRVLKFPPLP
jgi:DNA-binding beta-propeller fold protein YncE